MAFERDFAQILQEKLGQDTPAPRKITSSPSEKPTFPSWKFQFSSPRRTFAPPKIPGVYPLPKPMKFIPPAKKTQKVVAEPVFKIGELGLEFTSDLVALQALGADLDPTNLSLTSLKKEYRKLALLWHPDRCQKLESGKNFQLATLSYRNLWNALSRLTKK